MANTTHTAIARVTCCRVVCSSYSGLWWASGGFVSAVRTVQVRVETLTSTSKSNMSWTHHSVSVLACLTRSWGVVPHTTQLSSTSDSGDWSALAVSVVSTTLAALKEANGYTSVPALWEATGLPIFFLKGVQVSRDVYKFELLIIWILILISRKPIELPTPNLVRTLVNSSWLLTKLESHWTQRTCHRILSRTFGCWLSNVILSTY